MSGLLASVGAEVARPRPRALGPCRLLLYNPLPRPPCRPPSHLLGRLCPQVHVKTSCAGALMRLVAVVAVSSSCCSDTPGPCSCEATGGPSASFKRVDVLDALDAVGVSADLQDAVARGLSGCRVIAEDRLAAALRQAGVPERLALRVEDRLVRASTCYMPCFVSVCCFGSSMGLLCYVLLCRLKAPMQQAAPYVFDRTLSDPVSVCTLHLQIGQVVVMGVCCIAGWRLCRIISR
jgi:hypothetical protein